MHELALAENICEIAAGHAPAGQRVSVVVVEWGPLSGVVPEALEYCFDIVAPRFGLQGARLTFHRIAAAASCPSCQNRFAVESMWDICPSCGHGPLTVSGGREFRVKELEVEDV